MRGASQVLHRVDPRKGRFTLEAPKLFKELEDNASQLNRLSFTS
jgi:hypothetical protein